MGCTSTSPTLSYYYQFNDNSVGAIGDGTVIAATAGPDGASTAMRIAPGPQSDSAWTYYANGCVNGANMDARALYPDVQDSTRSCCIMLVSVADCMQMCIFT